MRVLVTGASGYVGSAIAEAFVVAGHEVTGVHHSPEGAERIRAAGAEPVQGDIDDPSTFEAEARDHDVYVHTAIDYGNPESADKRAIDAILRWTGGPGDRPPQIFIYTSGCWVLGNTGDEPVDEDGPTDHPGEMVAWRPHHEEVVLVAGTRDAETAVIRPGMVYGGGGGLVSQLYKTASEENAAAHVGDGANRWSLVYRSDLAKLYVRVAEKRVAGIFHGVDGSPLPVADIARAASIAAGAGGQTRSVPLEEARKEFGPVADALILDQALVARRSAEIGWQPSRKSFLEAAHEAFIEWKRDSGG